MANENLRRLLGLQSSTNVSPRATTPGNTFLAQRQADIHSGIDEWVPDADSADVRMAQAEHERATGYAPSRDSIRSGGMSKLRQALGLAQMEHERAGELADIKGQYQVASDVATQNAAMERAMVTQAGLNQRNDSTLQLREMLGLLKSEDTAERAAQSAAERMELERYRQGEMNRRADTGQGFSLFDFLKGLWSDEGANEEAAPVEQPAAAAPRRRILSVR